jgi:hypothetical protein
MSLFWSSSATCFYEVTNQRTYTSRFSFCYINTEFVIQINYTNVTIVICITTIVTHITVLIPVLKSHNWVISVLQVDF